MERQFYYTKVTEVSISYSFECEFSVSRLIKDVNGIHLYVTLKLDFSVQLWHTWRCSEIAVIRRTTLLRPLICSDTPYILIIWPGIVTIPLYQLRFIFIGLTKTNIVLCSVFCVVKISPGRFYLKKGYLICTTHPYEKQSNRQEFIRKE